VLYCLVQAYMSVCVRNFESSRQWNWAELLQFTFCRSGLWSCCGS